MIGFFSNEHFEKGSKQRALYSKVLRMINLRAKIVGI